MRPFKFRARRHRVFLIASVVAGIAIFAGCRPGDPSTNTGNPAFAVTISPLGACIRPIVEGRATVTVLLPPGASEHTYEVKPADARAVSNAAALIYFDESLDAWAAKLDARARVHLATLFPPETLRHYAEGDESAALDPHAWLDPKTVRAALPQIVAKLGELDPSGAQIYTRNGESFSKDLIDLDDELAKKLAPLRGRSVIQFHPSLFYFLERYGIRTAGVIETIAGQEPSPRQIKELADLIRAEKVEVIITEPQLSDAPVRALAEAAGGRIARMDPLGGVPGRETYAELLRYNADALLKAFP